MSALWRRPRWQRFLILVVVAGLLVAAWQLLLDDNVDGPQTSPDASVVTVAHAPALSPKSLVTMPLHGHG